MARRRGFARFKDRRSPSTFKIQITSMVDMFVILLVFLLKSYSTSPVNVTPSPDLTLPASTAVKDPTDVLKLVVSKAGIFVDSKKVAGLVDAKIPDSEVDPQDTQFIRNLYNELDDQAKRSRSIAAQNDTLQFDGKVLMQADRGLSYDVLRKVMYTAMMAGYSDVKIAVLTQE